MIVKLHINSMDRLMSFSRKFCYSIIAASGLLMLQVQAFAEDEIDIEAGRTLWEFCAFCHNAGGFGGERMDAPKLAGDPAWYTERQLRMFRNKTRGSHPDDQPGLQMFVYSYPLIDDAAIRNMAAFIETLEIDPADPVPDRMARRPKNRPYEWDTTFAVMTAERDADPMLGEELYMTCAACHGEQGEGNQEMNGPRLDNKQDWYLIRQLKYFKYGARGVHEDDTYGKQMAELGTPETDQDIVDVVAYIMTLSKGPMY
jgi:cytochrome c oxidase subunit 2